jgi:hypothetical protein
MSGQEIVPAAVTSVLEVEGLVADADKHYKDAANSIVYWMMDLSELFDVSVHRVYGHESFASWASERFDGMAESTISQFVRSGRAARTINGSPNPLNAGIRGLRSLATVEGSFGADRMITVYEKALEIAGIRRVSDRHVKIALELLIPPSPVELEEPEALEDDPEGDADDDGEPGLPGKQGERIDRLQDLAWDLPETVGEMGDELTRLKAELAGEDNPEDTKWLASGR